MLDKLKKKNLFNKIYCLVNEKGKTIYNVKDLSYKVELTINSF
jgi:hypothetical protein